MIFLVVVIGVALAFDLTNGFHDAANAIAAPVATRAARPASALALTTVFHVLGPLLFGTAVADTIGGILQVPVSELLPAVTAALLAALGWNILTWWWGLPTSSSHGLVGGLVGAGLATAGLHAIQWGGMHGLHPVGVFGVLLALAVSPLLGFAVGYVLLTGARRGLRRAPRSVERPIRRCEWVTAATLAFSHGANDAQKTMAIVTLMLVATNHLQQFQVPLWVKLGAAAAMTFGTALGGWRIVRTLGVGIYRIRPLDGLVNQAGSAAVILAAAALGGPVSTTHVVASSVVGVGAAQHRHHVRWSVVTEILSAWVFTMPATAAFAALLVLGWRYLS